MLAQEHQVGVQRFLRRSSARFSSLGSLYGAGRRTCVHGVPAQHPGTPAGKRRILNRRDVSP